jgi:phosphatidate cytidylyltransferase
MSPAAAIASPIFRFYVALIAILLLAAGVAIVLLRWKSSRDVTSAWKAYCGWLVMIPVVLGAIFLGRIATIVLFAGLSLLGFKEFARATGLYRDWLMTGAVYLSIAAVGIVSLVHDPTSGVPGWFGLFMAAPVYAISAMLLLPITRDRVEGQLQTLALAILGFIYIGWMFGHLAFLANSDDPYG